MNTPVRPRTQGSWETITTALDQAVGPGRASGAWTKYCCPVHEADGRGHRPSLGVKYVDTEQRTVVRCFAGCDNEHVMESLGLGVRDMFDKLPERSGQGRGRRANRPRTRPLSPADRALTADGLPPTQPKKPDLGHQVSPWRKVVAYPYVRADGSVAGEVIRREAAFEHGRDKDFRQSHWDRGSGRMEAGGFEPIPYRLPQVLDTVASGGVVYICEGEKDVAAAESAGLCATTNAGGATSWSPEHAKWLQGAGTVVIVADHDTAGYRRAERVMATLSGLVDRVRVVRAATGKDLHDHLQCGHEIAELVPIPHLDPHTPLPAAETTAAASTSSPAAEATVSASASPSLEGDPMAEYMLAPSLDTPTPHSDEVDHAGAQMAAVWRLMIGQLLTFAQQRAERRRRDAEEMARRDAAEQAEIAERLAVERKTAEVKLAALGKQGWDKASREELADAIGEARAWAPDSTAAAEAFEDLRTHLHRRFGVRIDPRTDEVDIDPAASELIANLADIERGRAVDARLDLARDRMVSTVAGLGDLDESAKQALYADIQAWKTNPTPRQLDALTEKLTAAKVPEQVRTRIRFTAAYLYDAGAELTSGEQAERGWRASTLHATHLLRQTDAPLVDPGEEAKPRIDALLTSYQDRLRTGANTDLVREKLSRAVALLTADDRAAARERGQAIRHDPVGKFAPLWPKHVDRDALTVTVNTYAALRPQADKAAVAAGDYSATEAAGLRKIADKQRAVIVKAAREGEGLHPLERDQLTALVRDIDAGRARMPQLMWVDERSAAQHDADRTAQIAADTSRVHRHQLDQILSSGRVDPVKARTCRPDIDRVMSAQTALAAGHQNLGDYGESGVEERLQVALSTVGVPEPIRNQVRNHLDQAAGEAAIAGKQANRMRDRWLDRLDTATTEHTPEPETPSYDSPQRREDLASSLRQAGLNDDQVAQHMAADAGHAKPPSAAAAAGLNRNRRTTPGTGAAATHHRRNKGRGPEKDLGL